MKKLQMKESKILLKINEHIKNNYKEYLSVSIIFLIGIIIGVVFINNMSDEKQMQLTDYINKFARDINNEYKIDLNLLLRKKIISNLLLGFLLWFMGSTLIGIPIVYLIVGFKGFSLGYTISTIMITFNKIKGILFLICSLLLQNILFIPCLLALAASGIKFSKSIIKDKRKENIKLEIVRHTIFSFLMLIILMVSSFIEVYASCNILEVCSKIFV